MSARTIEPFFFGPDEQRLFGVYHRPAVRLKVPAGAVLCYPILQEYLRSHRAFLRLATQLASRGWHVLRFDYSGCGDSYGDGPRDPEAWVRDLAMAANELRERSSANRLALIGLRVGASLAASAGIQPLSDLVLWDPVVDGPEYLKDLMAFRHAETSSPAARQRMLLSPTDRGVGLEITPHVLQMLGGLDAERQLQARAERVLVFDSQESASIADFAHRLGSVQANVAFKHVSERPVWAERKRNSPNNIIVPTLSLKAIVDWVTEPGA